MLFLLHFQMLFLPLSAIISRIERFSLKPNSWGESLSASAVSHGLNHSESSDFARIKCRIVQAEKGKCSSARLPGRARKVVNKISYAVGHLYHRMAMRPDGS